MSDTAELLTFPCLLAVKAMGRVEDDFDLLVAEIVRRHVPELSAEALSTRLSGNGRYISVTATITAHSRAQLDALYIDLSSHERVLMVL